MPVVKTETPALVVLERLVLDHSFSSLYRIETFVQ